MSTEPPQDRYAGARPFGDTDLERKLFHGRGRESETLYNLILAERMVVLYGRSGVGKTSLLNAGVLERIRQAEYLPLYARVNDPSRGPLEGVFDSVAAGAVQGGVEFVCGSKASLLAFFATSEFWKEDTLLTPVLIIDQFEELFTLQQPKARRAFAEELGRLLRGGAGQGGAGATGRSGRGYSTPAMKIVLSIREDFLGELEELAPRIPHILNTRFRVTPLGREQAKEAIEKPASLVDSRLATRAFSFGPGTIEGIVNFLSRRQREAGSRVEVEPFQLQLVCQHVESMVRRRPSAGPVTLQDLGGHTGLSKMLGQFYDTQISSIRQWRFRGRLRRLCERGLMNAQGRRLSLEENEIIRGYRVSAASLQHLSAARLLRTEPRLGSLYYELGHDSLVEPILEARRRRRRRRRRRTALTVVGGVVGVGLAVGLGLVAKASTRLSISKETTYFEEPVGADGTVNYSAALNRRFGLGVNTDNNAAAAFVRVLSHDDGSDDPVLRSLGIDPKTVTGVRFLGGRSSKMTDELKGRLAEVAPELLSEGPVAPGPGARSFSDRLDEELSQCGAPDLRILPWSAEVCPHIAAWLQANATPLRMLSEGAERTEFWIPLPEDKPPYAVPFGISLLQARNAGEALRRRALLRLGQGDHAGARADLTTLMRLGALLARGPTLIHNLIGIAIQGLGVDALPLLAVEHKDDSTALEQTLESLRGLPRPASVIASVDVAQRATMLAALSNAYYHRGSRSIFQGGDLDPELGLFLFIPVEWDHVFRTVNLAYDDCVAMMRGSLSYEAWQQRWEAAPRRPRLWSLLVTPRREAARVLGRLFADIAVPSVLRAKVSENELKAQLTLARLSLEAASYYSRHRRYPVNLAVLADPGGARRPSNFDDEGYRFEYESVTSAADQVVAYTAQATPVAKGQSGVRAFCVDANGPIRSYSDPVGTIVSGGACAPLPEKEPPPRRR